MSLSLCLLCACVVKHYRVCRPCASDMRRSFRNLATGRKTTVRLVLILRALLCAAACTCIARALLLSSLTLSGDRTFKACVYVSSAVLGFATRRYSRRVAWVVAGATPTCLSLFARYLGNTATSAYAVARSALSVVRCTLLALLLMGATEERRFLAVMSCALYVDARKVTDRGDTFFRGLPVYARNAYAASCSHEAYAFLDAACCALHVGALEEADRALRNALRLCVHTTGRAFACAMILLADRYELALQLEEAESVLASALDVGDTGGMRHMIHARLAFCHASRGDYVRAYAACENACLDIAREGGKRSTAYAVDVVQFAAAYYLAQETAAACEHAWVGADVNVNVNGNVTRREVLKAFAVKGVLMGAEESALALLTYERVLGACREQQRCAARARKTRPMTAAIVPPCGSAYVRVRDVPREHHHHPDERSRVHLARVRNETTAPCHACARQTRKVCRRCRRVRFCSDACAETTHPPHVDVCEGGDATDAFTT